MPAPTRAQVLKEIDEKLAQARALVSQARDLADDHDIEFNISIVDHNDDKVPDTGWSNSSWCGDY